MTALRLALLLALGIASSAPAQAADDLVMKDCLVIVRDEVQIPASESGVLMELPVREGSRMAEGDKLAVIDDREAQAGLNIAQFGLESAIKRATDMIEEKYARKAAEVAEQDWKKALAANVQKRDAVPAIEVMQKKLAYERSRLQIEKAQKDRELARLDARTKQAERDAAQMALDWRTITAPFAGEVVKTFRHEKEWVNPGDPILKLVRFDILYVEDFVDAKQHDRGDVLGQQVSVQLTRAQGKQFKVTGSVVYADQQVQSDGRFKVRAEVLNAKEGDNWLIQPGMKATMTIYMGGAAPVPQAGLPTPLGN